MSSKSNELAKKLALDDKTFALEYVTNGFNGTRAALKAWPELEETSAASKAYQKLRNAEIVEFLQAWYSEAVMTAEEALARTSKAATFDLSQYVSKDPYTQLEYVDLETLKADGYGFMLKSVKHRETKSGTVLDLEFNDQYTALQDILKTHGKLIDKLELSGSVQVGATVEYYLPEKQKIE